MKAADALVSLCWHQRRVCPFICEARDLWIDSGPMFSWKLFPQVDESCFLSYSYFWQTPEHWLFSSTGARSLAHLKKFYKLKKLRILSISIYKFFIVYLKWIFHYNVLLQVWDHLGLDNLCGGSRPWRKILAFPGAMVMSSLPSVLWPAVDFCGDAPSAAKNEVPL